MQAQCLRVDRLQQRLGAEFDDIEIWPLSGGVWGEGGDELGAYPAKKGRGANNFHKAPKDSGNGIGESPGSESEQKDG